MWEGASLEGNFGPHEFCGSGLPDGAVCDSGKLGENLCDDCTNEVIQVKIPSGSIVSFCGCAGDGHLMLPEESDKCCSGFVQQGPFFPYNCAPAPVVSAILVSF